MKIKSLIATVISALLFTTNIHAAMITINPIADGSVGVCAGCNTVFDDSYVLISDYIQGTVKFSTSQVKGGISQALLSLNPYGLPLWGPTVDVFGYETSIAPLDVTDANAGSFLGTLPLPDSLRYGEDVYFDVTSFVAGVKSPYVGFNLRSPGLDIFSSLEYNYGHPSQLLITPVPEPSSLLLVGAGLLPAVRARRKVNKKA
jgi:hypothetical protein